MEIAKGLDMRQADDIRKAILGAKISAMNDGNLTLLERERILVGLNDALDTLYQIVSR